MVIIGDRISASNPQAREAMERGDREGIMALARAQERAGATHLYVSAGLFHFDEAARMLWLMDAAQDASRLPLCIDTPSPHAVAAALRAHRHGKPILAGVTLDEKRLSALAPIIRDANCAVLAACAKEMRQPAAMGGKPLPAGADERVHIARELVSDLASLGVAREDVILDPASPLGEGPRAFPEALETIRRLRAEFPTHRILFSPSRLTANMEHGARLERAALAMAVEAGARAVMLDPLDTELMETLRAARALVEPGAGAGALDGPAALA
ncbi:MAG TPA: dihydropteroate synthase [Candidatus Limnocylindria bacterium]|nr:dihydropteroate synthase [Candidatus Limnocylindria bacterium]